MECRHVRSKFTGYVDGDLFPAERRLVDSHVADCPACWAELEAVRHFLTSCHEFLVCPEPGYTFECLRLRMAAIEPLQEVVAFLPKLRVNAAIPRFAVAVLLMAIVGGTPFTLRNTRHLYAMMRSPFAERVDQVDDAYQDLMDDQYREVMLGKSGAGGASRV